LEQNKPSDAEEQFARALQLGRDDAATHYRLALALEQQRKSKEAIAQFRAALRLKSDFPEALNRLARILSSEPDPKLRDGDEAVKLARQACELTGNKRADCLSTLAAAYAETGRFPEAIAMAQTARDAAAAAGEKDAVAEAGELLKMFQSGRPFRTPL
jgi:tetratricopeptide (TPR) repeat protein